MEQASARASRSCPAGHATVPAWGRSAKSQSRSEGVWWPSLKSTLLMLAGVVQRASGSCSACFREFFSVARELFSARRPPCKCVGLGVLHPTGCESRWGSWATADRRAGGGRRVVHGLSTGSCAAARPESGDAGLSTDPRAGPKSKQAAQLIRDCARQAPTLTRCVSHPGVVLKGTSTGSSAGEELDQTRTFSDFPLRFCADSREPCGHLTFTSFRRGLAGLGCDLTALDPLIQLRKLSQHGAHFTWVDSLKLQTSAYPFGKRQPGTLCLLAQRLLEFRRHLY